MTKKVRLNIGAGSDVRPGWINHDVVQLPGIDIVHNLNLRPWPWADSSIDEIKIYDVLEHLDELVGALEELHRILKPGGVCHVSVPYWNSWCAAADPTHKRAFHEITFQFFDPGSPYCRSRSYYSTARFSIKHEAFILSLFNPYFILPGLGEIIIERRIPKKIVGILANYFISSLIQDLRVTLEKI